MIKDEKVVKNQTGGLKVPLFDLKRSNVMFRCQNLIGSSASTHSTPNLLAPATNIRTDKANNPQSHKDTHAHTTER